MTQVFVGKVAELFSEKIRFSMVLHNNSFSHKNSPICTKITNNNI